MLDFGRDLCSNLSVSETREWLVTNGAGGFAAGTVAGLLTRRYHGLLVAALEPPLGRTLLVAKVEETASYDGLAYPLFANRWQSGLVEPAGYEHLDRFYLDGVIPVWEYACADAWLEKRIWMAAGENTTYVRYHLRRASRPLTLTIRTLVNYRDYHGSTQAGDRPMQVDSVNNGLRVTPLGGPAPFFLLSDHALATPRGDWISGFHLSVEAYRGLDAVEDHLDAGDFQAVLPPGASLTLAASTAAAADLDGADAHEKRQAQQRRLIAQAALPPATPQAVEQLALAADQFIVRRSTPLDSDGRSVIAGYPWFSDWGRDTMIALPGLTLSTGRPAVAASILRTFAHFVDQGMLPNRFPDSHPGAPAEQAEYNTADATLWYFEAIRSYHAATGDDDLLRELFPVLQEIVAWHQRGTRYRIGVDAADGLLYAGQPGVQLTWMDAKVEDWVVTPRIGKPVEINALWYSGLRAMAAFARQLGEPATGYEQLAGRVEAGFSRFWSQQLGYCYDVLDTPAGNDASLRPNQLLAVSLPHSPLAARQQQAVVDVCARRLLTPHGLRSLAPDHPNYAPRYGGDRWQRDGAYHQGTVWGWLIGPFVSAHLRVYRNPALARSYLAPLLRHLADHGVGSLSEIFDAEPPFTPRGCFAQAWTVAEWLRAWQATHAMEQEAGAGPARETLPGR